MNYGTDFIGPTKVFILQKQGVL